MTERARNAVELQISSTRPNTEVALVRVIIDKSPFRADWIIEWGWVGNENNEIKIILFIPRVKFQQ